ncbi:MULTISPECIES: helix-turn-helix domain-containing protein [unclassified Duganella]|uniref:helix-turn-helix domain-containing protein n=1 Tax=unclassified Duganella TaxID=2636909 RepID=UPI000885B081|nr:MULTISPECIES: helix-turn-helix domain-containing protein [unclassified Duganella]SDH06786.1 MarR family protein [Duganella sp. OV458]SDK19343.1 MarR family protein [Duganella sp. OV510]
MSDTQEEVSSAPKLVTKEKEKESRKKWGDALIDAGYTILPSTLVTRQKALGLEPIHVNILLVLLTYWWTADNLPYPTKKTMAEMIGVDQSTIRRRIAQMEKAGFIKRNIRKVEHDRNKPNVYDFSGLIDVLQPFAQEEIQAREAARVAKAKRVSSKKPMLKVA